MIHSLTRLRYNFFSLWMSERHQAFFCFRS